MFINLLLHVLLQVHHSFVVETSQMYHIYDILTLETNKWRCSGFYKALTRSYRRKSWTVDGTADVHGPKAPGGPLRPL